MGVEDGKIEQFFLRDSEVIQRFYFVYGRMCVVRSSIQSPIKLPLKSH